jgi:hypothetical protein
LFDALQLLREQEQTALAESYALDSSLLIRRFRQSVQHAATRAPTDELFSSSLRKPLAVPPLPLKHVKNTYDFTSHVADRGSCQVADNPQFDFEYVDYEIFPSRTTGPNRLPRRSLDLLLVNSRDAVPIFAEVKIGDDRNSFYALVQVLALAAEFASPAQRRRLQLHHGRRVTAPVDGPVGDAYVIALDPLSRGKFRGRLQAACEVIVQSLMEEPEIRQHLRRVVYLEARRLGGLPFTTTFAFGEGCSQR